MVEIRFLIHDEPFIAGRVYLVTLAEAEKFVERQGVAEYIEFEDYDDEDSN